MRKILIPHNELPADLQRSSFAQQIIQYGHEPGTLSLSGLQGKAKKYSGSYARTRDKAMAWIRESYGVTSALVLINKRYAKVWFDHQTKEQVEFVIVPPKTEAA